MPKSSRSAHEYNEAAHMRALTLGAVMTALVWIATTLLKLPVPMSGGYVHLGDGVILLSAALLGWVAVPAAALGSALADVTLGFLPYALPTLLIKGAVAALAVVILKSRVLWLRALGLLICEAVMIAGYFVSEWLVLGLGFAGAWANVAGNALQGVSGVVIGLFLISTFKRIKLPGLTVR